VHGHFLQHRRALHGARQARHHDRSSSSADAALPPSGSITAPPLRRTRLYRHRAQYECNRLGGMTATTSTSLRTVPRSYPIARSTTFIPPFHPLLSSDWLRTQREVEFQLRCCCHLFGLAPHTTGCVHSSPSPSTSSGRDGSPQRLRATDATRLSAASASLPFG
jgi:hypothetical protein